MLEIRNTISGIVKWVMPPFAEIFAFFGDLIVSVAKGPEGWKKPYNGFKKEQVSERVTEYVVKKDGKHFICREVFSLFAIRGKNRRVAERRHTYRIPTPEDLDNEKFQKQIFELEQ